MRIKELVKKFHTWAKDQLIDTHRVKNEEVGYNWVYKDLKYDDDLNIKAYQKFFDRAQLNAEYGKRYKVEDIPAKQQHAHYGAEISMIASFHKCFAMRNQTRLQYYRNDMSQKGARAFSAVNIALGKHLYLFEHADQ